jgi:hypothetical protein
MSTHIQRLAAKVLSDADGDVQSATEALVKVIKKDPQLYRALMDPLVREACYSKVREICRSNRQSVWNTSQPTPVTGQQAISALAQATRSMLLNFPLPGGKALGDATRAEVETASREYLTNGKNMVVKGRWLAAVARLVPRNCVVRQKLTEQKLQSLKSKAEGGRI